MCKMGGNDRIEVAGVKGFFKMDLTHCSEPPSIASYNSIVPARLHPKIKILAVLTLAGFRDRGVALQ